ncbi:hypothetical protein G6M04_16645 [Agrobacterium rhizogenes]|uniref:hypothetical protein n=1 Tax=Rhizobium rhizogenes TaxID=359 RepID=UPI00157203A6|nr:hypothetical protein [Rhizobium rhizogenes]NTG49007.1 hypothetical protein [Rhizobium rhizogenes]
MNGTAKTMKAMAEALDEVLNGSDRPKKNGFVLLVFPFGGPEGQRTNYVSNGNREDILVALKEIVARFEGQPHQSGRA